MSIYAIGITITQATRSPTGFYWRNIDELAVSRGLTRSMWPVGPAVEEGAVATDGKTRIDKIHIKRGQSVSVAILAANRNTRIWGTDADVWRPEPWLEGDPVASRDARLPGAYSSM